MSDDNALAPLNLVELGTYGFKRALEDRVATRHHEILERYGVPSELYETIRMLSFPSVHAQVEAIMSTIDVTAFMNEMRDAYVIEQRQALFLCHGGCGKLLRFNEAIQANKLGPGAPFTVCRECFDLEQARQTHRLARRNIKSALTRARAAGCSATLTKDEWQRTLNHFNNACAYCGKEWFVVEHAIPIEQGGGTTLENCVPACFRCNTLKNTRRLEELKPEFPFSKEVLEHVKTWLAEMRSNK